MKKVIKALIIASLLLLSLYHYAVADTWEQVVDKGFGEPSNDYAWSMATFQGKLYVGTLNSNRGAEIWSSGNGEPDTWQRAYNTLRSSNLGIRTLYADNDQFLYAGTSNISGTEIIRTADGRIWRTVVRRGLGDFRNSSIRCMIRFKDYLYAGTGSKMAKLYRSKDGLQWELVKAQPGFDSTLISYPNMPGVEVVNNILIGELAIFNNQLYAFTWTDDLTAIRGPFSRSMPKDPLLRVDPDISLTQRVDPDISLTQRVDPDISLTQRIDPDILSTQSPYDDPPVESMYGIILGRSNAPEFSRSPGAFEVWRSSDGVNWEKVVGKDDPYGNGMGFSAKDPANLQNDLVTSVTVSNGKLYLGTQNADGKTSVWRTSEGTKWEKVLDFWEMGEEYNFYVWRMISYRDKLSDRERLFIGTMNMGSEVDPGVTGAQIWASYSGDPGSFTKLVGNGFDGETIKVMGITMPKNYGIRSFGILNGTLFAGTATMLSIAMPGPPFGITLAGGTSGCEIWKLVPSDNDQYLSNPDASPVSSENTRLPPSTYKFLPSRNQDFASIKVADWNQLIQQRLSDAQSKKYLKRN